MPPVVVTGTETDEPENPAPVVVTVTAFSRQTEDTDPAAATRETYRGYTRYIISSHRSYNIYIYIYISLYVYTYMYIYVTFLFVYNVIIRK